MTSKRKPKEEETPFVTDLFGEVELPEEKQPGPADLIKSIKTTPWHLIAMITAPLFPMNPGDKVFTGVGNSDRTQVFFVNEDCTFTMEGDPAARKLESLNEVARIGLEAARRKRKTEEGRAAPQESTVNGWENVYVHVNGKNHKIKSLITETTFPHLGISQEAFFSDDNTQLISILMKQNRIPAHKMESARVYLKKHGGETGAIPQEESA